VSPYTREPVQHDAYRQYEFESQDWLKAGRIRLLASLLRRAGTSGPIDRLLEVGAGVGQNLPTLASHGKVDAAEIDPIGLDRLRDIAEIEHLYTTPIPFDLVGQYDVICALDVIEHLDDDAGALRWMSAGLRPGGHCIVSVPAFPWLFSDHDRVLGHRRRYTRSSLLAVFPPDLEVVRIGYFNSILFPAAVVSRALRGIRSRLRPGARTPSKQSSTVPAWLDRRFRQLLGLEVAMFERRPVAPFGLTIFVLARLRT
jgi:SAM-dependent methyltransferase